MPPASTSAAQDEVSALNRARDLAAQTDQGTSKLVWSLCGNVYACQTGLSDATLDIEPAPQRDHPNSHISFASSNAAGQRHSILRRLDMDEVTHPPQPVYHAGEDGQMKVTQMPGVFAGLAAQHPFQVMYAGRNKWMVGAGNVRVSGVDVVLLEATIVEISQGWICVNTDWLVSGLHDYALQGAQISGVRNLNAGQPPIWDLNDEDQFTVGEGSVLFPIAYVEVGSAGKRPLIQQSLFNDLGFSPEIFPWGLTGPRTSFF